MRNAHTREMVIVDDEARPQGLARWMPLAVVLSVLSGFIALAWYAYNAGVQSVNEADIPVVEADKTPMKERPLDPGGMQFPNQDKTIFDTFSGPHPDAKVERVLPLPEEPMVQPAAPGDSATWVNRDAVKPNTVPEPVFARDPKKIQQALPDHQPVDAPESETYVAPQAAPQAEPAVAPPAPVQKAPEIAPESKSKTVTAPSVSIFEHASTQPAPTGGYKVQLGSFPSEKEARDAWATIQRKQSALNGKQPHVARADLGDKGIRYRLRVGGLASAAAAKTLCDSLTANKQACIVAGNK